MRMKYTMSPYPNTHVYLYNGRLKIERQGKDEFVEFDETVRRSWERLLWAEGFRPLDEEGNVIMKQSPKSAPMTNLRTNDDNVDVDHKQSIDPAVFAGNNAEFQALHADELAQMEENARLAAEGKVVNTTTAEPTVTESNENTTPPADLNFVVESPVDVDPLKNAPAFGLSEEQAAEQTQSNAVAPTSVDSNNAPENVDDDDEEDDDEGDDKKTPTRRRRRKNASERAGNTPEKDTDNKE